MESAYPRNWFHFLMRRTFEKARAATTILLLFIFIVIIDVLFLYIFDLTFQARKKDLIATTWKYRTLNGQFIDDVDKAIAELARLSPEWPETGSGREIIRGLPEAPAETRELWRRRLLDLLRAPHSPTSAEHPIFQIRIYAQPEDPDASGGEQVLFVRDEEKFQRLNTFENSFISREFRGFIDSTFSDYQAEFEFTNPSDAPEIAAMAWEYRLYGSIFVLFSLAIFVLMLAKTLLPIHRVAVKLEFMQRRRVETLPAGRTRVERAYNALARNTQLLHIGRALGPVAGLDETDEERGDPWERMGARAPEVIRQTIPFETVAIFSCERAGEPPVPMGVAGRDLPGAPLPPELTEAVSRREPIFCAAWQAWIAPILFSDRAIGLLVNRGEEAVSGGRGLSAGIAAQIENLLLRLAQQQVLLDREKNEISINLCTNMGHDLTNVIATSKWDVDTVRRALDSGLLTMREERLAPLMIGSVQGLLNNTRFLQEIVDIYRAFGYTKRPEYGSTDVAALVREVVDLFKLSTTRDYRFETHLEEAMPPVTLEPRLMKLALFNLVTNASQAITRWRLQQGETETSEPGVIALSAAIEGGELVLAVRDNGSGFRRPGGELMNESELGRIFAYGFSTKDSKTSGTGIGLSWVRTIVEEYHHGKVIPRNLPEGGAEMGIRIPLDAFR